MNIEHLNSWNPWWSTKEVPAILKGILRPMHSIIHKSLHEKEIIVLTGVRRSGKSTLMYQMIASLLEKYNPSQLLYINLDDEALKGETLESIYACYRGEKNPREFSFVFLDEIQNIDNWEKFVKKYYDLKEKVKFIVSGSSAGLLKGDYASLLTGRNLTFTIFPLSFKEYIGFSHVNYTEQSATVKAQIMYHLNTYLEYGGFPEVYFKEEELKILLLKQYFDDVIYKDIVKRYNVNAKKITELAVYLLTNSGNFFSMRKIRSLTGLSFDSIKDYISYLEEAHIAIVVDSLSYSLKERSQLPKKSYSLDSGLRNSVCFRFSGDRGRLAENCVCIELLRRGKEIYYWKGKGEVDFVVKEKDNSLVALNVSYADEMQSRELRSLAEFRQTFKKVKKCIIITRDFEDNKEGILFIPLWKWLLSE
jgi:predicted AAA+ superfamily ATPase